MDERTGDQLPELGTKAAAVAGIESMIHHAIGGNKICTPVQLRYWLDAYYQARLAAVGWMETPHQSPAATASPQGEAQSAEIQVDQFGFEKEGDGAAVSAPPEQADASDGQEDTSSVTAETADPSPQGDGSGPMKESAPTEAEERKPQPRPVGWTDGFEAVEVKKCAAAEAAEYKRGVRERFLQLRAQGLTLQRVSKEANGNISDDQILGILEGRRVPVAVYRVLAAVLDRIEDAGA